MTTVQQHYGGGLAQMQTTHVPDRTREKFICGCEFEIESVKSYGDIKNLPIIVENDHSLRNNGKEFKTPPMYLDDTVALFKKLHKSLVLGPEPFSERTSIHVHVNVRELEMDQARQLVLTYALLEPLFFDYVGDKRKNSIFCVPLNFTYMPGMYKHPINYLKDKWHKYTAFNIVPMGAGPETIGLGTVEFRHLYGTNDVATFETWLNALQELYLFIAKNPEFNLVKHLEEGAQVADIANTVVPTLAKRHTNAAIRKLTEDSLLDVKLSVGGIK